MFTFVIWADEMTFEIKILCWCDYKGTLTDTGCNKTAQT